MLAPKAVSVVACASGRSCSVTRSTKPTVARTVWAGVPSQTARRRLWKPRNTSEPTRRSDSMLAQSATRGMKDARSGAPSRPSAIHGPPSSHKRAPSAAAPAAP